MRDKRFSPEITHAEARELNVKVIRRGGVSDPPEGRCGVAALPRQRGQGAEGLRAGVGKGRRAVRELQWRQHSRAPENRSRLRETEGREEGTRVFFSQHPVETLPGAPNPHALAWSAAPPPSRPPGLLLPSLCLCSGRPSAAQGPSARSLPRCPGCRPPWQCPPSRSANTPSAPRPPCSVCPGPQQKLHRHPSTCLPFRFSPHPAAGSVGLTPRRGPGVALNSESCG